MSGGGGSAARALAPDVADERTRVRDRQSGAVFDERVFGEAALRFFYQRPAGRTLAPLLTRTALPSHLYGWWQRMPWSRRRIPGFVASLGVDTTEAERPLADYRSLDEFFSRRLRPGARPVDANPEHLVAPCDGRVLVEPRLAGPIRVKRSTVTVADLLADAPSAGRYGNGVAVVFRLAPVDYHRFHFPDSGLASAVMRVRGGFHSVHPIASAAGAPSFRNQRAVTWLETDRFGTLALIEVGALVVATIVQTFTPGPVARGAEKGYFCFGGSTVVLLAEAGCLELDADLIEASAAGLETLVRMGTRIGRRPAERATGAPGA